MGGVYVTYVASVYKGQRHVVTLVWSFKLEMCFRVFTFMFDDFFCTKFQSNLTRETELLLQIRNILFALDLFINQKQFELKLWGRLVTKSWRC